MRKRIWILGALITLMTSAIVAFRPPSDLVLNLSCEPDGPIAKVKSLVQGHKFWEQQRDYLEQKIAWYAVEPERQAKAETVIAAANADLDRILADHQEKLEQLYRRYPELRPSPEQLAADKLRVQSDALERADFDRLLSRMSATIVQRLQTCRSILDVRSNKR